MVDAFKEYLRQFAYFPSLTFMLKNIMDNLSAKPSKIFLFLLPALCVFFLLLFSGLGIWQVQRLQWKNALIERVEARLHLEPILAPAFEEWDKITSDNYEYQPVYARGRFLPEKSVLVTAVTDYGTGYWLMMPLQVQNSTIIFVNRGFVPMDWRVESNQSLINQNEKEVSVTGLLRMGEGAGFFPRRNEPQSERWYSRQLEAFAEARSLKNVAPYFIDANARPGEEASIDKSPIGGLTVVSFNNNHLSYAITWFVMAAGVLAAFIFLIVYRERDAENPLGFDA